MPAAQGQLIFLAAGDELLYDEVAADLDAGTRGDIDLRLLGLEQVDLMLLHWPCATMAQTTSIAMRA